MPTFFTHLDNGNGYQADTEGANYPDLEAARAHAICSGADILAEELKGGCMTVRLTFHIEDADNKRLVDIPMTASIDGRVS